MCLTCICAVAYILSLFLCFWDRDYPECHFMPTEFAAFRLKTMQREDMLSATDILGRVIDYRRQKPVIFLANIANMHWNLIRVQHWPIKELQLFEPMGKPPARQSKHHGNGYGNGGNGSGSSSGGISMRYIPQHIVHWLDTCWPLRGHFARCARVRGLNATASALDGDEDDDDDIGGDGVEFVGSSLSLSSSSSSSSSRSTSSSSATTSSRGRSPAPLAAAAASGAPSSNSSANGRNGKNGSSKSNHGSNGSSNGNGNGGASSTPPLLSLSDDPLTWLRRTTSAITSQHQMNGFDCGVRDLNVRGRALLLVSVRTPVLFHVLFHLDSQPHTSGIVFCSIGGLLALRGEVRPRHDARGCKRNYRPGRAYPFPRCTEAATPVSKPSLVFPDHHLLCGQMESSGCTLYPPSPWFTLPISPRPLAAVCHYGTVALY